MEILLIILAFFAMIGLMDDLLGNRIGVADQFAQGIASMGSLAIPYSGFYCIGIAFIQRYADVIAGVTAGMSFDPSLVIGCILCADTGGLPVALQISKTLELGIFTGALVGGSMGLTLGFQMPIFMSTVKKEHMTLFMQGIGYGLITLPSGLLIGGSLLGLPLSTLLINTAPVAVLCIILLLGFRYKLQSSIRIMIKFGNILRIVGHILFSLVVLGVFVPSMALFDPALTKDILFVVLRTTVVTTGGLVMSSLVIRHCQKPLSVLTRLLKVNTYSIIGILISCVSGVAMLPYVPRMDRRGLVMNAAFAFCGAYIIGGQMAFVSCTIPGEYMPAYIVNKLVSGIVAAAVALRLVKPEGEPAQLTSLRTEAETI